MGAVQQQFMRRDALCGGPQMREPVNDREPKKQHEGHADDCPNKDVDWDSCSCTPTKPMRPNLGDD